MKREPTDALFYRDAVRFSDITGTPDVQKNSIGIELVLIPAGEFAMGSPLSEKGRYYDEGPVHPVRITKPFYLGATEVTQGQWKAVMRTEPWKGKDNVKEGDNYPVVHVNWYEAVEFCRRLSNHERKKYRLPTEAEWEYACRAGSQTMYSFGDSEDELSQYGWHDGNAWDACEKYAHRIRQKAPNGWGLYDMHGNVWEWCSDWYGAYPSARVSDPQGPRIGSYRVGRGGGWGNRLANVRSAYRGRSLPTSRDDSLGFRVACNADR